MLILLPPSEGKTAPRRGRPVDVDALSLPGLAADRRTVLDALAALCTDPDRAQDVLGLGDGLRDEITRNTGLPTAPAAPAAQVYTGVLYDALGLADLPGDARRRARRHLLIFSALWGVVSPGDRIPAYRCSAGVALPGPGALTGWWRARLAGPLAATAGTGVVLDLRSSSYTSMWRPTGATADRTVTVRVLHERVTGGRVNRTVVSHFNKATKGRIVRDLLLAGATAARTPDALITALRDLSYHVEVGEHRPGRPVPVDVVVHEL